MRRFVFDGSGQPVVWYEGSGTTDRRFMGADERGSIISLTDSSGALIAINRYDEYGKPQSTNLGRFQYTGQKWIAEIGGYDYHFRDYLPHLGIFAQTDPAGYGDGPNWYAYVRNDPVDGSDPLGLAWPDNPCPSIGGAVVCTGSSLGIGNAGIGPGGFATNPEIGHYRGSFPPLKPPKTGPLPKLLPCGQQPGQTKLGAIAEIAGNVSTVTSSLALGSLALGAVTSETGVALTFGGLAAGLEAVSFASAGISAEAKYFSGDVRGAISSGAGAAVGAVVPRAMGRALSYSTGGERLVAGIAGEGYGQMTSSIVCQAR